MMKAAELFKSRTDSEEGVMQLNAHLLELDKMAEGFDETDVLR